MSLAELSIKRPVFILSVVILMLILGASSLKKMSVDLFPDITFPVIFIQTIYQGASPYDMEKLVSKPIEDELGSMAGLNKLTSSNSESVSVVVMEFKLGTDIKDSEQQIRQRLGNIRRKLPTEIQDPIIRRFDPADQPIVRLAVTSNIEAGKLYDIVSDVIKPRFETINGVGQINIVGGRKREILVEVDKRKVEDRKISLIQIADKIRNTSKDVPIGNIDDGKIQTSVRASGEFQSVDAIRKVNIQFLGSDQVVNLDTVAKVVEGLEEEKSSAAFLRKEDGFVRKPTLYLDVYKQSGSNTVKVVDTVIAQIPKANEVLGAKKIEATIVHMKDMARPIRLNVQDVRESILIGIGLLILVVFFFLGSVRSTFITGMALPNSLLGGFILMYLMGFSINIMTLLALSLAVGLLIDDAIVVRENIFRHLEMGKSPIQAAIEGTKEVTLAVIATTLVVIAVFGPIAFLDGIVGQFFKQFGLSIVFMMLISLFDAFTVAPMLSAFMATKSEHEKGHGPIAWMLKGFEKFQDWVEKAYVRTLEWVLENRITTLSIAFVIFIISMGIGAKIPKTFLNNADNGEFYVSIELPVGTALRATQKFTLQIEDELKKYPYSDLISTVVGASGLTNDSNKASIFLKLVPSKKRPINTTEAKEQVRILMAKYQKEGVIQVGEQDIAGGGQKPLTLNISGDNLEEISAYVDKLRKRIEKIPGLADVDTNYRTGKPELQVVFNRSKSEALGVSTVTAGAELRARTDGLVSGTYREQGREYDIRVRLTEKDQDLNKEFSSTTVPNSNFDKVPLWKVSELKKTFGYSMINRQDKARFVNITANLGAKGGLGTIIEDIEKILKEDPELKIPSTLNYRFLGQAESLKELLENMILAMGLGVCFIYLVLASLYNSFITPFSILLALPLAITGAFVFLYFGGKSVDIFSLIGIVMLLGVSAKNSILLVDYTQKLMEEGMDRTKAILKAGRIRLRPILMTSFALIAGTLPVALGLNEASAQRTSMGVAIIGGLISSTFLTLVVVPAAFGYIDDFKNWTRKIKIRKD